MIKLRNLTRWQRTEIVAAFKKAKKIVSEPELDIRIAPALLSYGRILIIIPKKVGSAPQRNLLRRRIKAIFYGEQLYTQPYDWIIILKPPIISWSFQELRDILLQASKTI